MSCNVIAQFRHEMLKFGWGLTWRYLGWKVICLYYNRSFDDFPYETQVTRIFLSMGSYEPISWIPFWIFVVRYVRHKYWHWETEALQVNRNYKASIDFQVLLRCDSFDSFPSNHHWWKKFEARDRAVFRENINETCEPAKDLMTSNYQQGNLHVYTFLLIMKKVGN